MTNQQTTKSTPVKKLRFGSVGISIWCDNRENPDGKDQHYWSVIMDKTYTDASGNRQYAKTFAARDITNAIYLMQKAADFIMEQQEKRRRDIVAAATVPEIEVEAVVG